LVQKINIHINGFKKLKSLKILFILNSISRINKNTLTHCGGIEFLNLFLAKLLAKQKNSIYVAIESKINKKFQNINITYIKKIKNKRFDIVINSNSVKNLNFFKKAKKIIWLHNKLQIEKAFRRGELFNIFKNKPNVVFVSKFLMSNTSNLYPFKNKIIIPNGYHPLFNNKKKNIRKNLIICFNQRSKGLQNIIDIFESSIEPNSDSKLLIFGVKKNKKKSFYYKSKKIIFFGRVNRKKLANYFKIAKVFLHPGFDETFCISALEASASGLPIITLGKTALKDRVINNYNGFIVKNYEDISCKILELFNDTETFNKMSKNAITYSKRYNWNKITTLWSKYFYKIK